MKIPGCRAEDLAGVVIVGLILFSACVAGYQSVTKLIYGSEVSNVGWVGNKIGSAALVADGQHARADGFTSLAVVAGSLGVALGYPVLDPLVGLAITAAILFIVKDSALSMWRRMMDAVEPEIVWSIEEAAVGIPGVEGVRRSGLAGSAIAYTRRSRSGCPRARAHRRLRRSGRGSSRRQSGRCLNSNGSWWRPCPAADPSDAGPENPPRPAYPARPAVLILSQRIYDH
ncbi:MAG: cation transporter [Actinomycetota bacterium]|nr:cation transporter [Actinomycetota bacterium]